MLHAPSHNLTWLRRVLGRASIAGTILTAPILWSSLSAPPASAMTSRKESTRQQISSLRLIDYFPSSDGWTNMWTKWDPRQLSADFGVIASLHANAVRIIVPADTFGYPDPSALMMSRLRKTVSLAAAHGLKSELTLFDGWNDFSDIAGSETWLSKLLAPFRGDTQLAYIDLHNELPTDTDPTALQWAVAMVPYAKRIAGGVPVTVSTSISSGIQPLWALVTALAHTPPDLYDVHYYGKIDHAFSALSQAKALAGRVPLFVGETGFATNPSYLWATGLASDQRSLDAYQRFYLQTVEYATSALALPPAAPWILYDFRPGAMNPGSDMPPYEYHFGLLSTAGDLKPAGEFIRQFFGSGRVDQSFNNGFEDLNESGTLPTLWKLWEPSEATFSVDHKIVHSGNVSARIDDAGGSSAGCPGFYTYPITAVRPGAKYAASAWAKGRDGAGTARVVLAWFNADDKYIGQNESSSLSSGTTGWTRLSVGGEAPAGAAAVELHLTVCNNPGTTWWDDATFAGPPLPVQAKPKRSGHKHRNGRQGGERNSRHKRR